MLLNQTPMTDFSFILRLKSPFCKSLFLKSYHYFLEIIKMFCVRKVLRLFYLVLVSCVEARSLVPVRETVEIKSWYQNSFLATKAWRSGKSIVRNNVLKQYQRL